HAMHRIVLAQRAVIRERIVDEIRRQALEIEIARSGARLFGREPTSDAVADSAHTLLRRQPSQPRAAGQGIAPMGEFGHGPAQRANTPRGNLSETLRLFPLVRGLPGAHRAE